MTAAAAAVLRPYLVTHLAYPARGAPARLPCLPFPLLAYRTPPSPKSSHSSSIDPIQKFLFIQPGVEPGGIAEDMVLPGSNIVIGPYAGHSHIKEVEFVGSSGRAKDCPKDGRPEFAILGPSNVGKTQLINHFLVNKSWYIVNLPGYGFAKAPGSV